MCNSDRAERLHHWPAFTVTIYIYDNQDIQASLLTALPEIRLSFTFWEKSNKERRRYNIAGVKYNNNPNNDLPLSG